MRQAAAGGIRRGHGAVLLPCGWRCQDSQTETGKNSEKAGSTLPSFKPQSVQVLSGYKMGWRVDPGISSSSEGTQAGLQEGHAGPGP